MKLFGILLDLGIVAYCIYTGSWWSAAFVLFIGIAALLLVDE
jgi:hypothetical protein